MDNSFARQLWTSSLLKALGVAKTFVPSADDAKIRKYCTALLLAAATAISGFSAPMANATSLSEMGAEQAVKIVNAQSNPSKIDTNPDISAFQRGGAIGSPAIRQAGYNHLIEVTRSWSINEKIEAVNNYFNQNIGYKEDLDAWGKDDYWATPSETLTKGVGDCEDFAIGKYYALVKLGVPVEDMKITYVKSGKFEEAHMVLLVDHDHTNDPLVLDNMVHQLERLSYRTDLIAAYAFNEKGLFLPTSKQPISGTQRLSKWQAVIDKVDAETRLLASAQAVVQAPSRDKATAVVKKTVKYESSGPGIY
jgi:predicted transglutaminase-like cysteine proteinase